MLSWGCPDKGEFKFLVVVAALILAIVFVLAWGPDYRERSVENARKECLADGGQFGIVEGGRWFCLEPRP